MTASSFADRLYGTAEPVATTRHVTGGALGFEIADGTLRALRWNGVELIRGISYPIRDRNWGTLPTRLQSESLDQSGDALHYSRRFETADASIAGTFEVAVAGDGATAISLTLVAREDVEVNRAGFTVLHPIQRLAGSPLTVVHADGTAEATTFPALVMPGQPARDIAGLAYEIGGCRVELRFSGDVFEMEDQRNWTDASYKTYCRPLGLPYPYRLRAGEPVHQSIALSFSGSARAAGAAGDEATRLTDPDGEVFAEILLATEPGWQDGAAAFGDMRQLLRLDLRDDLAITRTALERIAGPFDLELITSDDAASLSAEIGELARMAIELGRAPDHVAALPAAFLRSYQPDGAWPGGAQPEDAVAAARAAFPAARIGGGMLTNFTEFNRRPPQIGSVDYVTHGSSAIVHAADDRSVFETLEALPQVFASARALADGKPYRLGLVSIGTRTNPYGEGVAENPGRVRRPMAIDDPRAGALFGAAWLVGAAAATTGAGIEAVALGAPSGPLGLLRRDRAAPSGWRLTPAFHVVRRLAQMSGSPRFGLVCGDPRLHGVAVEEGPDVHLILANGSAETLHCRLPGPARLSVLDAEATDVAALDVDWIGNATAGSDGPISLPPYAVAFATLRGKGDRP